MTAPTWLQTAHRAVPNPSYKSWGYYTALGVSNNEPNNYKAPELCVLANFTTRSGAPEAWGWADGSCLGRYASICKILRGCPACGAAGRAKLVRDCRLS